MINRHYDVLIFVANVHNLAYKGKNGSGDHLAHYHENLNPEPHFKRVVIAIANRSIPAYTRCIKPDMIDISHKNYREDDKNGW